MIKINLNQTVSKAQLEQIKEEQKKWIIFGSICGLFIIYLVWFLFISNRMTYIIDNRIDTIQDIKIRTEELKKKGKINLSKKDINTLNNFEKKRMFWAPKLIELSKITPEDMTITGLEFDNKRLEISAISIISPEQTDMAIVENFMNKIMSNEEFNNDFKNMKIENISRDQEKGQKIITFTVEARLR